MKFLHTYCTRRSACWAIGHWVHWAPRLRTSGAFEGLNRIRGDLAKGPGRELTELGAFAPGSGSKPCNIYPGISPRGCSCRACAQGRWVLGNKLLPAISTLGGGVASFPDRRKAAQLLCREQEGRHQVRTAECW